ncbi:MAG: hypothetical protein NT166_24210 [Candidatus Aminicenantes bacterium]|nr:hypothetical protein [Candidatus Aminicenantes bacterium]
MIDVTGVKEIIYKNFGDCLETIGNINLDKSFVLVYNDKKNPSIDADVVDDDTPSKKGKRYKTHVRSVSVRLGLGIYKNKFFKEIKIYSPANFKKWFKKEEFLPA